MNQAVILAGGLATRLRPLTNNIPKSMIRIDNKPFLEYQINLLKNNGIDNIVICLGYRGEQIKNFFGDGDKFGVKLNYSRENQELLGTGGALKKAEPLLFDKFFLLYGDSYLPVNYQNFMSSFCRANKNAAMTVYKNCGRYDTSNILLENNLVKKYDKINPTSGMKYIDAGLLAFKKTALSLLIPNHQSPLSDLLQLLIKKNQLLALETKQRFYEIGSFNGLAEFRRLAKRVS